MNKKLLFEIFVCLAGLAYPTTALFSVVVIVVALSGKPLSALLLVALVAFCVYLLRALLENQGLTFAILLNESKARREQAKELATISQHCLDLQHTLTALLNDLAPGIPPLLQVEKSSTGFKAWGILDVFELDSLSAPRLKNGLQSRLPHLGIQDIKVTSQQGNYLIEIFTIDTLGGVRNVKV